jgi:hypothetical protein
VVVAAAEEAVSAAAEEADNELNPEPAAAGGE